MILNFFIFTQMPSNAQQEAVYSCRTGDIAAVTFLQAWRRVSALRVAEDHRPSLFLASSRSHWVSQRCLSRNTKLLQPVVNSALPFQRCICISSWLFLSSRPPSQCPDGAQTRRRDRAACLLFARLRPRSAPREAGPCAPASRVACAGS